MTTITRQQLTDCIDPHELQHADNSKRFNDQFLWLWGGIVCNDIITVSPACKSQIRSMFQGWTQTQKNLDNVIGV